MLAAGKDGALLRFSLGNEYLKAGDAARARRASAARGGAGSASYTAAWKLLGRALPPSEAAHAAPSPRVREGIAVAQRKGDKQAEKAR